MEFLLGLLVGIAFFGAFLIGKYGQKPQPKEPQTEKKETEIQKIEQIRKDFVAMMNYDVDKALQQKRILPKDGE